MPPISVPEKLVAQRSDAANPVNQKATCLPTPIQPMAYPSLPRNASDSSNEDISMQTLHEENHEHNGMRNTAISCHSADSLVLQPDNKVPESGPPLPSEIVPDDRLKQADVSSNATNLPSHIKVNEDHILNEDDTAELHAILSRQQKAFVGKDGELGCCKIYKWKIHLKPGAVPKYIKPYRFSPHINKVVSAQIDDYIKQGVVAPIESEWNSPILVIPKGIKKVTCSHPYRHQYYAISCRHRSALPEHSNSERSSSHTKHRRPD